VLFRALARGGGRRERRFGLPRNAEAAA
jgi:hypothetical protein